ncbi:cupin domain-containing protein [Microbacterium sp. 22303]|uniref:cupin domain-containing protein n=1 Tax=Microbacterium sp. 22303 TaxID=3453905 RepID=UPI003F8567DA
MTPITSDVELDWPTFEDVDATRVLYGSPGVSTIRLHHRDTVEFGLWRVTPGAFKTERNGQDEFIYILSGEGDLVGVDGTTFSLFPGATVVLPDGWRGYWAIRTMLTKVYTLMSRLPAGAA